MTVSSIAQLTGAINEDPLAVEVRELVQRSFTDPDILAMAAKDLAAHLKQMAEQRDHLRRDLAATRSQAGRVQSLYRNALALAAKGLCSCPSCMTLDPVPHDPFQHNDGCRFKVEVLQMLDTLRERPLPGCGALLTTRAPGLPEDFIDNDHDGMG